MTRIHLFACFLLASICAAFAEEPTKLDFHNANVRDVVAFYQQLIAKKVIYGESVQGLINVAEDMPVSREKAVELIEKTLFANGFPLVDVGDDIIEVIGLSQNPRTVGVPTCTKPEEIPRAERVLSYVFKVQHRDAAEVQALVAQHLARSNYSSVIADAKTGTIVVTERTSVIRSLLPIVAAFDSLQPAERK